MLVRFLVNLKVSLPFECTSTLAKSLEKGNAVFTLRFLMNLVIILNKCTPCSYVALGPVDATTRQSVAESTFQQVDPRC